MSLGNRFGLCGIPDLEDGKVKHLVWIVIDVLSTIGACILSARHHGELRFTWALIAAFCLATLFGRISELVEWASAK